MHIVPSTIVPGKAVLFLNGGEEEKKKKKMGF